MINIDIYYILVIHSTILIQYNIVLGLAKQFVVPGWRVGWLIMHDKDTGRLQEVKKGIKSLTQIVLGNHKIDQ